MSASGVYQIDIQTNAYGEFITNVYHVQATSIENAGDQGLAIANIVKALLPTTVNIDFIRVSTPQPRDNVFYSIPVQIAGTRASGGDVLPPFNRYRIDFSIGYRRPLRKFLLWPIEGGTTGGGFSPAEIAFVTDNVITPLITSGVITLCSADGYTVLSAALNQRVGMRQLRRASKRKIPVIG